MYFKIDIGNQVRQTALPHWKPLLPVFEAVMNAFQAIDDTSPSKTSPGRVTIEIKRSANLFDGDDAPIESFVIRDNGIGLDDENFDSFNTAFSRRKSDFGGKGLGRFTWLKAFSAARIESCFVDTDGTFIKRDFIFNESYAPEKLALPQKSANGTRGTTVELLQLHKSYQDKVPRSVDAIIQKLIEHFILIFMEPDCPVVDVKDGGKVHNINQLFEKDYRSHSSNHNFELEGEAFTLNGFRLPTSRTTKHKLIYAADKRSVISDNLEDFLPNLASRLQDKDEKSFFYLAILQSPYLSQHVNTFRTDFDFSETEDADFDLLSSGSKNIPRAEIRDKALEFIQKDLESVIQDINSAKLEKITRYVQSDAPQYRVLLKSAHQFVNRLSPLPSRAEIETQLHKELHHRETELRKEGVRIIKEAGKVEDYEDYRSRLSEFLDNYNELGMSALAQYVGHRKIIIDLLERAIQLPEEKGAKYPLEEVVHKLVFPMRSTSEDIPYYEQNLWMLDERLTYHSLIASDKELRSLSMLDTKSRLRSDIVIFDQKILFSDSNPSENPISSIVIIEFKRPGRDDYTDSENPLRQAFRLVEEIRSSKFKIKGRPVVASNEKIPATVYCVCDLTPTMLDVLKTLDAFETPDKQGLYGFHRTYGAYFEVVSYDKMLSDAKKRNRIFLEKLNLVGSQKD